MVPWLTLRGLPMDLLEGFSADHRLTFRGLPAECLGMLPHEATSCKALLDSTGEVLLWLPREGLSWDKLGTSFHRGKLLEVVVGPASSLHQNAATTDAVRVFLGPFGGVVDG